MGSEVNMHYVRNFFMFRLPFSLFKSMRICARRFVGWIFKQINDMSPHGSSNVFFRASRYLKLANTCIW